MIFNSIPFLFFFIIVLVLYYLVPQRVRYVWLLICSYLFYLSQSTSFVALLLFSTIITYVAGLLLHKAESVTVKNIICAVTIVLNVGLIAVIKYSDFVLDAVGSAYRFNFMIPIGISFYTFQALSYVIDCYRQKIPPMRNILRYALYVSFFPSLLSGPINRASDLMPELMCKQRFDLENIKQGMQRMLWGYFLKLVIAARLTILVDNVYADPMQYSGVSLLCAAIAFLFMLYCDFEGYSCMAIGAAKMLGINMKNNFRQPFYSLSMAELWRRWHISLSTWLREYLYFPLGGNQKGTIRKYINTFIVFVVSGLWHGANYTFMIWGFLNGFFLVMGNLLINRRNLLAEKCGLTKHVTLHNVLRRIGVYCLYGFTMIFFANDSITKAWQAICGIVARFSISGIIGGEIFTLGLGVANLGLVVILSIGVLIVDGICNKHDTDVVGLVKITPAWMRWTAYLLIMVLILFSANLTGKEFIYSQM